MYIWWSIMTVKLSSCLCLLLVFVASASIYWYCLLFVRFLFILIFLYCKIVIFTVCCFFLCYLMAFDCQELKGLLTYLLTYKVRPKWLLFAIRPAYTGSVTLNQCVLLNAPPTVGRVRPASGWLLIGAYWVTRSLLLLSFWDWRSEMSHS